MLDITTRTCSHCGDRFTLTPRRGRNSGRRRPNSKRTPRSGRPSLHYGASYCSPRCRQAAFRARLTRAGAGQHALKSAAGTDLPSSVTRAKKPVLDPRIVPDERWPGMYRIRRPDGSLSDMVNLTRARDALLVGNDPGPR